MSDAVEIECLSRSSVLCIHVSHVCTLNRSWKANLKLEFLKGANQKVGQFFVTLVGTDVCAAT